MELLIPLAVVSLGGIIKGLNGFGYAVVSTPLLAIFMPGQEAVALMIIPLIAGNFELVAETSREELERCLSNFSSLILSLSLGVTIGTLALRIIPSDIIKTSVGVIAILFAASKTPKISEFFTRLSEVCFKAWEPIIGFLSGLVYGSSNIGVPIVAYLESTNLSRERKISALAIIILGISVYRVLLAQYSGLYAGSEKLLLSAFMALPAILSVRIGTRFAQKVPDLYLERFSVLMIAAIGFKLVLPF